MYVGAPLIVVMFVAGTAAVLAFVAPADIDLVAPIPQVLRIATAGLEPASHIASVATVLWVVTLVAAGGVGLAGITRLPMVAGWDGLLPAWFMRLGPRSRVPVNSILFVSAVITVLSVLGLTGVEHQEAYQLFLNAGLVCWALTYLVMFAIPIVGRCPGMPRPPVWLRVAAASGWGMTLLFVVFAVVPIVRVESAAAFGVKMAGVVVAPTQSAWGCTWRGRGGGRGRRLVSPARPRRPGDAGAYWIGHVAAKKTGTDRSDPVLRALREAPERVLVIAHTETSDSLRMFVSHWVVVTTADGQLRVRADWESLMAALERRCRDVSPLR